MDSRLGQGERRGAGAARKCRNTSMANLITVEIMAFKPSRMGEIKNTLPFVKEQPPLEVMDMTGRFRRFKECRPNRISS